MARDFIVFTVWLHKQLFLLQNNIMAKKKKKCLNLCINKCVLTITNTFKFIYLDLKIWKDPNQFYFIDEKPITY